MSEKKPAGSDDESGRYIGMGVVLGAGLGTVIGASMDNVGLGIAIGTGIGVVLGAALSASGHK